MASSKRQRESELDNEEYSLDNERKDKGSIIYDRIQEIVEKLKELCPEGDIEKRTEKIKRNIDDQIRKCEDIIYEERKKRIRELESEIGNLNVEIVSNIPRRFVSPRGDITIFDSKGIKMTIYGIPQIIYDEFYDPKISDEFKIGHHPKNDVFFKLIKDNYLQQSYTNNVDSIIESMRNELDEKDAEVKVLMEQLKVAKAEFEVFEKTTREEYERIKEELRNSLVPYTPEVLELIKEKDQLIYEYNMEYADSRCKKCKGLLMLNKDGEISNHYDPDSWNRIYSCHQNLYY